jgi:hypothetical protein
MKKYSFTLVILFLVVLTACSVPANLINSNQSDNSTPVLVESKGGAKQAQANSDLSQRWSNAPLSDGILVSRTDTVTEKAEIFFIDPANGLPISSAPPLPMGGYFSSIRSLDGKTLVAIAYPNSNDSDGLVHFIDLPAWRDTSLDFKINGYVGLFNLSSDGNYLAFVTWKNGSTIYLVDMRKRDIIGHLDLRDKFAKMHFTGDGSGLMVYMNQWDSTMHPEILPSVMLLDVPGLKIQWEKVLEGVKDGFVSADSAKDTYQPEQGLQYNPGIAFSPVEDKLFVVHADENRLTTVDFAHQSVGSVEIVPRLSWLERLLWLDAQPVKAKMVNGTIKRAVVSTDGSVIYVTGTSAHSTQINSSESEVNFVPLGFQIIDAKNGTELAHYDINTDNLGLSPDGHWIFLYNDLVENSHGSPVTQIFDPTSGEVKFSVEGHLYPVYKLNGDIAYVSDASIGGDHQNLSIFDTKSFKKIITLPSEKAAVYFSWLVEQIQ